MKKRNLLSGFALAALMTLGITGVAKANTYTSCASFVAMSPPPTGDVVVNEPGACSLPSAINVTTGSLTITAGGAITASSTVQAFTEVTLNAGSTLTANGTITTGNNRTIMLTAPGAITTSTIAGSGHVGMTSSGSTITVNGVLQSALGGTAGNILLQANGNIKTVAITTNAGGGAGGVEIDANKGGGNTLFKIGASSANGINGVLTTHNGTFITNGTAASTGGITITNGSKIVTGSASADGGLLFFNAQMGTFELTAGTLKTDGVSGHHSGSLVIMADTVKTAGTAVISASQAAGTAGINHFVGLSTKNLNITGTSLAIKSDGDGVSGFFATSSLVPPGALTVASNGNLVSLSWIVTASNTFSTNVPVAVTGGALTMTANGNSAQVQISGYPVTFSNTTIDLESKGKTNHSVQFDYFATGTGPDGLIFNNTGLVTIDASGTSGGTGGFVDLQQFGTTGGGIRINTPPTFTVNTNGPSSGGNAGPVNFNAGAATIGASTKVVITANGPSAGAGNGALITLHPGTANLKFGTNNGDIQLSSNGGSTTGDAGTLDVQTFPTGSITIDTANAVSATVPGTDGKGGTVTLFANGAFSVTSGVSGATINVDGKGTKDGGSITIFGTSGSVNLGTAAGGLSLSASGTTGTGNGGSVDIGSLSLTLANDLSVSAGTGSGGNGHGGTMNFHGLGGFTVSGTPTVKADGHGTGIAGSITAAMFSFNTMTLDNATFSASGDTAGSGKGGQLTFTNLGSISAKNSTLKANGGLTGSGGSLTVTGSASMDLSQSTLQADSGTSAGDGGTISLSYAATSILNAGNISASGPNGLGGTIQVTNTADADLMFTASGMIQTLGSTGVCCAVANLQPNTPSSPEGLFVANAHLPGADAVVIKLNGGFNSIAKTAGKNVTITATANATVGVDVISATQAGSPMENNITITLPSIGSSIQLFKNSSITAGGATNLTTPELDNAGTISGGNVTVGASTAGTLVVTNLGLIQSGINPITSLPGLLQIVAPQAGGVTFSPLGSTIGSNQSQGNVLLTAGTITFNGSQDFVAPSSGLVSIQSTTPSAPGIVIASSAIVRALGAPGSITSPTDLELDTGTVISNNGSLIVARNLTMKATVGALQLNGTGSVQALTVNAQVSGGGFTASQTSMSIPGSPSAPAVLSGNVSGAFSVTLTDPNSVIALKSIVATQDILVKVAKQLSVTSSAVVNSTSGAVTLQVPSIGSSSITIGSGATVEGDTNVLIFLGSDPNLNLAAAGTTIAGITQSGNVRYGMPTTSINTGSGGNSLTALSGSEIILNPGGASSANVLLSGGVTINAGPHI